MLLFLLGIIVGVIFSITLVSILSAGAIADDQMENIEKKIPLPLQE